MAKLSILNQKLKGNCQTCYTCRYLSENEVNWNGILLSLSVER